MCVPLGRARKKPNSSTRVEGQSILSQRDYPQLETRVPSSLTETTLHPKICEQEHTSFLSSSLRKKLTERKPAVHEIVFRLRREMRCVVTLPRGSFSLSPLTIDG